MSGTREQNYNFAPSKATRIPLDITTQHSLDPVYSALLVQPVPALSGALWVEALRLPQSSRRAWVLSRSYSFRYPGLLQADVKIK